MMAAHALPLALVALVVPLAVYRRVRRTIGRQPLAAWRLKLRGGIVTAVLVALAAAALARGDTEASLSLLAGTAVGAGIGLLAVRHTRFETVDGVEYYVPHPWIALGLVTLLLGRMGYRLWQLWPMLQQDAALSALAAAPLSPLTLGLVGLLLAYAATLSGGLLLHMVRRGR